MVTEKIKSARQTIRESLESDSELRKSFEETIAKTIVDGRNDEGRLSRKASSKVAKQVLRAIFRK